MKRCLWLVSLCTVAFYPLPTWADHNPDFDDDARPILEMQPGLVDYVDHRFEVKDRGEAKFPGNDDRHPIPPYIFSARPRGSGGPYFLRLLIQPGPMNHILKVVDMRQVHLPDPASHSPAPSRQLERANNQTVTEPVIAKKAPASVSVPAKIAPSTTSEPTADTPSGPILDSGGDDSKPRTAS